jgi:serpin B
MKTQKLILILLPLLLLSCGARNSLPSGVELIISKLQYDSQPQVSDTEVASLVTSNAEFTFDLYKKLAESDENFVFSPYSISRLWAMVWAGADGETADEIAQVLHFDTIEPMTVHKSFNRLSLDLKQRCKPKFIDIKIADSIWPQKGENWNKDYLDQMKTQYNIGIYQADYQADPEIARNAINSWIFEKTEKHFKDAIDKGVIDNLTVMVLVDTIFFAGAWENTFNPAETKDTTFTLLDGNTVNVPMMSQMQREYKYFQDENYTAVELPYKGNELSMLVIMPDLKTYSEFESQLNSEKIGEIYGKLIPGKINLYLPKFEFEQKKSMKDVFKSMGIKHAFSDADFTKMRKSGGLWVEHFLHGAYIKVDEKGTEAAGFSTAIMYQSIMPDIAINHPFIFLIRENSTGSILFAGRVMDPSKS